MKKANQNRIVTLSAGVRRAYNLPKRAFKGGSVSVLAEKVTLGANTMAKVKAAGSVHYVPWSAVSEVPCHWQT